MFTVCLVPRSQSYAYRYLPPLPAGGLRAYANPRCLYLVCITDVPHGGKHARCVYEYLRYRTTICGTSAVPVLQ